MLKKVAVILLLPHYWRTSSSTMFRRETPRLAVPKTGKAMTSLASLEAIRSRHSHLALLYFRLSSAHLPDVSSFSEKDLPYTRGKRP